MNERADSDDTFVHETLLPARDGGFGFAAMIAGIPGPLIARKKNPRSPDRLLHAFDDVAQSLTVADDHGAADIIAHPPESHTTKSTESQIRGFCADRSAGVPQWS